MDVGARIRELRQANGLSTRALADLTGISQPVITRLENNTREHDVDILEKICKALDMTLADFFENTKYFKEDPPEQVAILHAAKKLSKEQLAALLRFLDTLNQ